MNKESVDNLVKQTVAQQIIEGEQDAIKVATILNGYASELKKQSKKANEGNGEMEEEEYAEEDTGDSVEEEPAMAAEQASPGPDDAAILAALSGGEDMGADEALGGMEGSPEGGNGLEALLGGGGGGGGLEALLGGGGGGGGDAAALAALLGGEGGGGGLEALLGGGGGGGMPGGEAGGMPDEAAMLAAALQEAGISPDQMVAAASIGAKKASAIAQRTAKVAGQIKAASAGNISKWKPKTAEQRKQFNAMLSYVEELKPSLAK